MEHVNTKLFEPPRGTIAGVGEKIQYLVHELNDNTVRFALHYPCDILPEIMEQAVLTIVNRVDVLHSSFLPGKLEAFWIVNEQIRGEDCFCFMKAKGDMTQLVKDALLKPVRCDAKAQLFCTLIQAEEESVVVVSISHLCVDGRDGKYLLEKLMQTYNQISDTGKVQTLEIKCGSRSAFQVYKELSGKDYFSVISPKLPKVKTEFPFSKEALDKPDFVQYTLSAEIMKKARARGKLENATVNDLLLTACYRAFACFTDVNCNESMSIMSMMDLRRHCKNGESEGLCNMSGTFPTVLTDGICGSFADTLREICIQTGRAKENPLAGLDGMPLLHTMARTMPMWLLIKIAQKVYGSVSVGFTNMGNIEYELLAAGKTKPVKGIFAGPLKKKPGMQVSASGFEGNITLCCIGEYNKIDAKKIQTLFENMEKELLNFIAEEKPSFL